MNIKERLTNAKENTKTKFSETKENIKATKEKMTNPETYQEIRLTTGFINANVNTIDKVFEKLASPDDKERMWRKCVYNKGGEQAAEILYHGIIEGNDKIDNPVKYQSNINPYNIYNLALYIEDGHDIDADYITDSLADRINDAAEQMGFEEIYHFEKKDENGNTIVEFDSETNMPIPFIIRNDNKKIMHHIIPEGKTIFDVINEDESLTPDEKSVLIEIEEKRSKDIESKFPAPEPIKPYTQEDYEAEIAAYKAARDNDPTLFDPVLDEKGRPLTVKKANKLQKKEEKRIAKEEKKAEKEAKKAEKDQIKTEEKKSEEAKETVNAAEPTKTEEPTKAEKIIEVIEKEIGKPEEQKKKTSAKKTNLKEVVDPFEEILGQPAPAGEEKTPEKESVSSTTKSRKTGGKATAKKSV